MPWCDTDAMAAHLIEISAAVDPGAHAVLIVDQAGWHLTPKLAIPDNITVLDAAATIARVEPGGECLAIHARQLVVEPDLQILRRHRRAVLPSLEQPHRPSMEDHVPRHAQMGAWVLINDRWYKPCKNAVMLVWAGVHGGLVRFSASHRLRQLSVRKYLHLEILSQTSENQIAARRTARSQTTHRR